METRGHHLNAQNAIDFYKADHRRQYPEGTEMVFSNWTARGSRIRGIDRVALFGLQYYCIEYLLERWGSDFFEVNAGKAIDAYLRRMRNAGVTVTGEHLEQLHDYGRLPVEIYALPEGTLVPLRVPSVVLWNTKPWAFWLTNYLETSLSFTLWGPCTSATIANEYRRILDIAARTSGGDRDFVPWQGHDFSCRGMYGYEAAVLSGAGHLLSFTGTDTVGAIDFLERYYGANSDTEVVGGSVPATEHSVMCMGGDAGELETFRRLITEVYPSGVVSIVADTWDFWRVATVFIPALKPEIMARDGCVTIRPDSGDPVKIICGDPDADRSTPAFKGAWECLWDTFGGTATPEGFKLLDSHVNLIYGDSITLDRAREITGRLLAKGFVPRMVLGIGSYTYQHQTRDTFGFAVKATAGSVNGEIREIYKAPKTDNGVKNSARGLLAVFRDEAGRFYCKEQATWAEVRGCAFDPVFSDGRLIRTQSLGEIRSMLDAQRHNRAA